MYWFEVLKNWHAFSWIIPGVVFIHISNKQRPIGTISLSGWSYVISFIIVAFITSGILSLLPSCWFDHQYSNLCLIGLSSILSFILALICSHEYIAKCVFADVHDIFCKNCLEWEENLVIVSLSNRKIYIGYLWKYPENPRERYELQSISIIPVLSGHRNSDKPGIVEWTTQYPDESETEIIIPRKDIITFGLFDDKIFTFANPKTPMPIT